MMKRKPREGLEKGDIVRMRENLAQAIMELNDCLSWCTEEAVGLNLPDEPIGALVHGQSLYIRNDYGGAADHLEGAEKNFGKGNFFEVKYFGPTLE